jgi:hypothetical protein
MTDSENDFNVSVEEQDVRTRIAIIERTIDLWQFELDVNGALDEDHIKSLEKNIKREHETLEKMKEMYPEYFI